MATTTISGRVFELKPILPFDSFRLQPLFAPAVGRLLALLFSKASASGEDASIDALNPGVTSPDELLELGAAAGDIIGTLKPADLATLVRGLLGGATCDGVPLWIIAGDDSSFNRIFLGRTRDLWALLWFAIRENYPDFFPRRRAASEAVPAASPSATSSSTAGVGPSSDSSMRGG